MGRSAGCHNCISSFRGSEAHTPREGRQPDLSPLIRSSRNRGRTRCQKDCHLSSSQKYSGTSRKSAEQKKLHRRHQIANGTRRDVRVCHAVLVCSRPRRNHEASERRRHLFIQTVFQPELLRTRHALLPRTRTATTERVARPELVNMAKLKTASEILPPAPGGQDYSVKWYG